MAETRTYRVDGMSCDGCVRAVSNALRKVAPAADIYVDLATHSVSVAGIDDDETVRGAIERAGFEYRGPATD